MNEDLKPILIFVDTEKVNEENVVWQNLIENLNAFFGDWKAYFQEDLSLDEFRNFQQSEDKAVFIKEKYVLMRKAHVEFIQKMEYILREYLRMVNFPPFNHLITGFEQVSDWMLRVHADDLHRWFERCHTGNGFVFLEEMQAEIVEKHSTYARTPAEILAYHYQCSFCDMINLLADAGRETDPADLPPIFLQGVLWKRTKAVHWLEKPPRHCEPGPGLMREGSALVTRFSKFPEDHILKLIKEFSGEDVFHN